MQIVYDLKTYLAQVITQQIGTVVDPATIEIQPGDVSAGGVVIRPKVNGVVYEIPLAKINMDVLAKYLVGKKVGGGNIAVNVLKELSNYLKISLNPEHFTISWLNTQAGIVEAKPTNPIYTGLLDFDRDTKFKDLPKYFWPLNGTLDSQGSTKTPLADNFKFVDYLDKKWATLKDGQLWADLGINLSFAGNVTIMFDLVASDLGNMYGNIFSSRPESSIHFASTGMFTGRALNTNQNKWGLYGLGYGSYSSFPTSKLTDTPITITIVHDTGILRLYEDGVLKWTITSGTAAIWRYFGSLNRRNKQYLRNLTVWQSALNEASVQANVALLKLMP